MSEFGYNMAAHSVDLFNIYEAKQNKALTKKEEEINRLLGSMGKLQSFLDLIDKKTADSDRLDFSTKEEQDFVDRLREEEGLHHFLSPAQYVWKTKKEVESLVHAVRQYIEVHLQNKLRTGYEETVLNRHETNKILDISKSGMTNMLQSIERMLAKMASRG